MHWTGSFAAEFIPMLGQSATQQKPRSHTLLVWRSAAIECTYANDAARCDVDMSSKCQLDAGVLCCSNYGHRGRATVSFRLGMTVRAGRAGRADMAAKAGKAGRAGRKGKQARENIRLIHFGFY